MKLKKNLMQNLETNLVKKIHRRDFLVYSALATTSMSIGYKTNANEVRNLLDPGNPLMIPTNFEPTALFTMEPNGITTIHVNKCEMGQHIGTAFAQIISEELELDWKNIRIDYPGWPDNIQKLGVHFTAASSSISEHFDELSRAGVAGRIALLETGAEILEANLEDCIAKNSKIIDTWSGNSISYSDILSQTTIERKFDKEELMALELKKFEEYNLIGKPLKALDSFEKINGSAKYGIDSSLPGMIYATVLTPPTRKKSVVKSFNDEDCKSIKGYIKTVNPKLDVNDPQSGWLIILAKNFPAAIKSAKTLKVDWEIPQENLISTEDLFNEAEILTNDKSKGAVIYNEGSFDDEFNKSKEKHEAIYKTSFVAHGLLEPYNAVVGKFKDTWHIITGTQANSFTGWGMPPMIAERTGVPVEEVKLVVHQRLAGGGYGSRGDEATRLALIASIDIDKPVKLIYTRDAMMKATEPRTATYQKLTAGTLSDGTLHSMKIELCAGSMMKRPDWGMPPDFFQKDLDGKDLKIGAWTIEGEDHWYSIPNRKFMLYENEKLNNATPVTALRSISNGYMIFTVESFIDEIARKLNKDPLEYRLAMLNNNSNKISSWPPSVENLLLKGGEQPLRRRDEGGALRLKNVLLAVAGKSKYSINKKRKNFGIGIAVAGAERRKSPTWNACVAEVYVDTNSGIVDVKKLTFAIDCGTVINRDGAMAQIEGSALFGLSMALHEELVFKNGQFPQKNFNEYKMLRLKDSPKIEIELIETGGQPVGLGEPATTTVAPAVANAIYDAVGIRIKKLPIRPDDIRNQLSS
tara:strand:+ start:559 stop:2979 length:2421 start_codon:yes stop_codon:yes gene_type:complete